MEVNLNDHAERLARLWGQGSTCVIAITGDDNMTYVGVCGDHDKTELTAVDAIIVINRVRKFGGDSGTQSDTGRASLGDLQQGPGSLEPRVPGQPGGRGRPGA